jgi:hypothetical protein
LAVRAGISYLSWLLLTFSSSQTPLAFKETHLLILEKTNEGLYHETVREHR